MTHEKYKIEKGIPITRRVRGLGPGAKYPFEDMEIGDSFLVPCSKEDKRKKVSTVIGSSKRVSFMKFCSQYRPKEDGVRIWRIS